MEYIKIKPLNEYKRYKGKESDFQTAIATYLDFIGVLWFHPPNEIKAKPQYMAKRKRQGVKPGIPDICIMEPNKDYSGLFIEIKANYNKPSDYQLKWAKNLNKKGYLAVWSNSFDECKDIINGYLSNKLNLK